MIKENRIEKNNFNEDIKILNEKNKLLFQNI